MSFHDIKLKEIFEKLLGKELADKFSAEVNEGFEKGLTGKDLQDHIEGVWNKYKEKTEEKIPDAQHNAGCVIIIVT